MPNAKELRLLFVNPTLYPLGAYGYFIPDLVKMGFFPADASPWPVLVTDLRVIVEMLRSPAELIHYLEWRASLQIGQKVFVTDELDIFGAYLFGHVGREALESDETLIMGPATADFDAYYAGRSGEGEQRPAPRRVLGDFFEAELERLAIECPRRWLERSFAILDLSVYEAAALTARLEVLWREGIEPTGWTVEIHDRSMLVALGPDTKYTEIMLQLPAAPAKVTRRFVGRVGVSGPSLLAAERLRRR